MPVFWERAVNTHTVWITWLCRRVGNAEDEEGVVVESNMGGSQKVWSSGVT